MPNRHHKRRSRSYVVILLGLLWLLSSTQLFATQRDRARDLGILLPVRPAPSTASLMSAA